MARLIIQLQQKDPNPNLPPTSREEKEKVRISEPLTDKVHDFWGGGSLPDDFFGEVLIPPVLAVLFKRQGHFPFWMGEEHW